jgi:hypothetical protein
MSGYPYDYQIDRMGEVMPPEAPPISGLQSSDVHVPAIVTGSAPEQSTEVPTALRHEGQVDQDELMGYAAYQAMGGAMGFQSPETRFL